VLGAEGQPCDNHGNPLYFEAYFAFLRRRLGRFLPSVQIRERGQNFLTLFKERENEENWFNGWRVALLRLYAYLL
jgi:hypothetical protein